MVERREKETWFARARSLMRRGPEEQKPPMVKILVEGGSYDGWLKSELAVLESALPADCTRIKDWRGSYFFDLVGHWTDNGIERVHPETVDTREVELDLFEGPQRPTFILAEDGRIFFDLDLLFSREEANRCRLQNVLDLLEERSGTINPAKYPEVLEGPGFANLGGLRNLKIFAKL